MPSRQLPATSFQTPAPCSLHCNVTPTADMSCEAEHPETTRAKQIVLRVTDRVIGERSSPSVARITERIGERIRPKERGARSGVIRAETTAREPCNLSSTKSCVSQCVAEAPMPRRSRGKAVVRQADQSHSEALDRATDGEHPSFDRKCGFRRGERKS